MPSLRDSLRCPTPTRHSRAGLSHSAPFDALRLLRAGSAGLGFGRAYSTVSPKFEFPRTHFSSCGTNALPSGLSSRHYVLSNGSPQRLEPDLFLLVSARLEAAPFQN